MERPHPATAPTSTPRRPATRRAEWPLPTALILLSLVPLLGGVVRLISLTSPAPITEDNARFVAAPIPVILHILSATPFSIIGAFQFVSGFRRRNGAWHRSAGKWLMVAGMIAALSGVWMTVAYPIPAPLQGPTLYIVRLIVGVGMAASIWLAWTTIRQRNVAGHRAWMIRAYALGQGAGTQVLIFLPFTLLLGQPNPLTRDILMSAAWAINLGFAEWLIRRQR